MVGFKFNESRGMKRNLVGLTEESHNSILLLFRTYAKYVAYIIIIIIEK